MRTNIVRRRNNFDGPREFCGAFDMPALLKFAKNADNTAPALETKPGPDLSHRRRHAVRLDKRDDERLCLERSGREADHAAAPSNARAGAAIDSRPGPLSPALATDTGETIMDMSDIASGISSLKTAIDIVKALRGSSSAHDVEDRILDLKRALSDAYSSQLDAQQFQAAILARNAELEAKIMQLEQRAADSDRYELKTIGPGAVAYMLKPEMRGSEPPHWLCPTCFERGNKSVLQVTAMFPGKYRCSGCGTTTAAGSLPGWVE